MKHFGTVVTVFDKLPIIAVALGLFGISKSELLPKNGLFLCSGYSLNEEIV